MLYNPRSLNLLRELTVSQYNLRDQSVIPQFRTGDSRNELAKKASLICTELS